MVDIPGEELSELGIRIRYTRNPYDGTVKNTLAYRRSNGRIFFGIARYNPNDKKLEGIQPTKKLGRAVAIGKLYEAEKSMYDSKDYFCLNSCATIGSCDESGGDFMLDWLYIWAVE